MHVWNCTNKLLSGQVFLVLLSFLFFCHCSNSMKQLESWDIGGGWRPGFEKLKWNLLISVKLVWQAALVYVYRHYSKPNTRILEVRVVFFSCTFWDYQFQHISWGAFTQNLGPGKRKFQFPPSRFARGQILFSCSTRQSGDHSKWSNWPSIENLCWNHIL